MNAPHKKGTDEFISRMTLPSDGTLTLRHDHLSRLKPAESFGRADLGREMRPPPFPRLFPLGEVTRQSIDLTGPLPRQTRMRFYNPDVEQRWMVRNGVEQAEGKRS